MANAFDALVDLLDGVLRELPALDVYVQIFGASRIRLLEKPLVDLYAELIAFGIETAKLFDKSTSSMVPILSKKDVLSRTMFRNALRSV
jgi:hypothetical protein